MHMDIGQGNKKEKKNLNVWNDDENWFYFLRYLEDLKARCFYKREKEKEIHFCQCFIYQCSGGGTTAALTETTIIKTGLICSKHMCELALFLFCFVVFLLSSAA